MTISGNHLKKKRIEHNLTQLEVANQVGFSNVFLARIEAGKCMIPARHIAKISKILDFDKEILIRLLKKDADARLREKVG